MNKYRNKSWIYNKYIIEKVGHMYKFICINIGYLKNHNWPLKFWGHKNFADLINAIHNKYSNLNVILVGGANDIEDAKKIINIVKDNKRIYNCVGCSNDIRDTAAIIKMSIGIIGSDGGLQHIAATLNIPSVTIFTFTNPIKNRPYASNAVLAMTDCEHRITCQHGRWKTCQDKKCINVPFRQVLDKVEKILDV